MPPTRWACERQRTASAARRDPQGGVGFLRSRAGPATDSLVRLIDEHRDRFGGVKKGESRKNLAVVELATPGYVDWYNTGRLHTTIGGIPPADVQQRYDDVIGNFPV
jgi:hypothetical protein